MGHSEPDTRIALVCKRYEGLLVTRHGRAKLQEEESNPCRPCKQQGTQPSGAPGMSVTPYEAFHALYTYAEPVTPIRVAGTRVEVVRERSDAVVAVPAERIELSFRGSESRVLPLDEAGVSAFGGYRSLSSLGKNQVCGHATLRTRRCGPGGIQTPTSSGKGRVCDRYTTGPCSFRFGPRFIVSSVGRGRIERLALGQRVTTACGSTPRSHPEIEKARSGSHRAGLACACRARRWPALRTRLLLAIGANEAGHHDGFRARMPEDAARARISGRPAGHQAIVFARG